jgi:methylthioribose-1-phosphate isomerase
MQRIIANVSKILYNTIMIEDTREDVDIPIVQASRMRQYFMPGDHIDFKIIYDEAVGHHSEPNSNDLSEQ